MYATCCWLCTAEWLSPLVPQLALCATPQSVDIVRCAEYGQQRAAKVRGQVYNSRPRTVPAPHSRLALAPHTLPIRVTRTPRTLSPLPTLSYHIRNMLTAVSSWEPHPVYVATQDDISPASSCYSSPTRPLHGWSKREVEAAEALVLLSRSARVREYPRVEQQAASPYHQSGYSYSQGGISYQLVGPACPGVPSQQPVTGYSAQARQVTGHTSATQPIAGPSILRGSRASSPRSALEPRSASPDHPGRSRRD